MGICTNCGKTTNEEHICSQDFVGLKNSDHQILKMMEDFLLAQPGLSDEQRSLIDARKTARNKIA